MGKRKTARKPVVKAKSRLPTVFNCLYCNHEKSVEVKMDRTKQVGTIRCNVCQESWQTSINALSEPVDVAASWLDACEAAQQEQDAEDAYEREIGAGGGAGGRRRSAARYDDDEGAGGIFIERDDVYAEDEDAEDDLDDYRVRQQAARRRHYAAMDNHALSRAADAMLDEELI